MASHASRPRAENDDPRWNNRLAVTSTTSWAAAAAAERDQHRRDLLASTDEMPGRDIGGVRCGRDDRVHPDDDEVTDPLLIGDAQQDRCELGARHRDRVLAQAERRGQHHEDRVRERDDAAIFEPERKQFAEHQTGAEKRERVGIAGRIGQVRDDPGNQAEHADEHDPTAAIHGVAPGSRGFSRISSYSAAFGGQRRADQPVWSAKS